MSTQATLLLLLLLLPLLLHNGLCQRLQLLPTMKPCLTPPQLNTTATTNACTLHTCMPAAISKPIAVEIVLQS
jgi:hypothetical protein